MDDPLPPSAEKLARQQQKMDRKKEREKQREEKQARREQRQLKRQKKLEPNDDTLPLDRTPRESWMTGETFDATAKSRAEVAREQTKEEPKSNVVDLSKVALPASNAEPNDAAEAARRKFGDAGSSWRMLKLKRTREAAAETGSNIEDVAMERYGVLFFFSWVLSFHRSIADSLDRPWKITVLLSKRKRSCRNQAR